MRVVNVYVVGEYARMRTAGGHLILFRPDRQTAVYADFGHVVEGAQLSACLSAWARYKGH